MTETEMTADQIADLTLNFRHVLNQASILTRQQFIAAQSIDSGTAINKACKYPNDISAEQYKQMYDREGLGNRIITIFPEYSWQKQPSVYETDDAKQETEFEKAWAEFRDQWEPWHYLSRVDELSRIGRFGIVIIGIDDGKKLSEPVDGVGEMPRTSGSASRNVIYLRTLDESYVKISSFNKNVNSPRFGLPEMYEVNFSDEINQSVEKMVHWSRVVHIAENRKTNEVYGIPAIQPCYNRLLDNRKVLGGGAEMWWKAAYQGLAITGKGDTSTPLDYESIKTQIQKYQEDLQRYLAMDMVDIKSLSPSVADPTNHYNVIVRDICITIGCPKRIFEGSERGELASSQDTIDWNAKIDKRNEKYVVPKVCKPFIQRLIDMAVLPVPKTFSVEWPEMGSKTEKQKAEVAKLWAEVWKTVSLGDVYEAIPQDVFMEQIGFDQEEIREILKKYGKIDGDVSRETDFAEDADEVEENAEAE